MTATLQQLAPLTAKATDEQLLLHVQRNKLAREPVQYALVQAYDAARGLPYAPMFTLNTAYGKVAQAIRTARVENSAPGLNMAADLACEVKVLRASLEGLEYIQAFLARWGKLSEQERIAEHQKSVGSEASARFTQSFGSAVTLQAFSVSAFLQQLGQTSIQVTATEEGDLLVSNAGKLTAEQRNTLTANKAAIVQALGTTVTI